MNILMVGRSINIGGTETMMLNLVKELKNKHKKNVYLCSAGGVLEKEFNQIGVENNFIKDIDEKNIKSIIERIKTIRKISKEKSIDIIHSHHRFLTIISNMATLGLETKVIHTAHYMSKKSKSGILLGKNIVAVGESVKMNLIENSAVDKKNIEVIYNGIRSNKEEKSLIVNKWEKKRVILTISRLSFEKGIDILLEAIPKVIEVEKETRFLVLGDGEEKKNLEEKIKELKISEYVEFLGSKKNIYEYINGAEFVVMPSRTEGLPLTPIEAFSKKKMVVGTKCAGIEEIVEDKVSGIITEINSESLAKGIIEGLFIKNKSEMERNAYEVYRKKFTLEKMSKEYIKYYENVRKK